MFDNFAVIHPHPWQDCICLVMYVINISMTEYYWRLECVWEKYQMKDILYLSILSYSTWIFKKKQLFWLQAEACKSIEYAMKKCPNGMYAEIKYDGERVQVHKNGDTFQYYSRSLKPVLPHKVSICSIFLATQFICGYWNIISLRHGVVLGWVGSASTLNFECLNVWFSTVSK